MKLAGHALIAPSCDWIWHALTDRRYPYPYPVAITCFMVNQSDILKLITNESVYLLGEFTTSDVCSEMATSARSHGGFVAKWQQTAGPPGTRGWDGT